MNTQQLYETVYRFDAPCTFRNYERDRLLTRVAPRLVRAGQRLLDVGCNDGSVMGYFGQLGLDVWGLDISNRALEMARARGLQNLKQGNVEEPLPFDAGVFDVVFWGDNAEHLLQPLATLREIHRVLKPSGLLLLSTPNMGTLEFRLQYLRRGFPPATEGHPNPPWEWEHIRFFNRAVLKRFLQAGGFVVEGVWACYRVRWLDAIARLSPTWFGNILLAAARPADTAPHGA
jgi:SAM-dependent methyltransferase